MRVLLPVCVFQVDERWLAQLSSYILLTHSTPSIGHSQLVINMASTSSLDLLFDPALIPSSIQSQLGSDLEVCVHNVTLC